MRLSLMVFLIPVLEPTGKRRVWIVRTAIVRLISTSVKTARKERRITSGVDAFVLGDIGGLYVVRVEVGDLEDLSLKLPTLGRAVEGGAYQKKTGIKLHVSARRERQ